MTTYRTILKWHENTSNRGKEELLIEGASIEKAEEVLMGHMILQDNADVWFGGGIISDGNYNPPVIWARGDRSLRYGDFTIVIEEEN